MPKFIFKKCKEEDDEFDNTDIYHVVEEYELYKIVEEFKYFLLGCGFHTESVKGCFNEEE